MQRIERIRRALLAVLDALAFDFVTRNLTDEQREQAEFVLRSVTRGE